MSVVDLPKMVDILNELIERRRRKKNCCRLNVVDGGPPKHSTLRQLAYRNLLIHLPFLCIYKYNCRCQVMWPTTKASTIKTNRAYSVLCIFERVRDRMNKKRAETHILVPNIQSIWSALTKINITRAKPIKLKVANRW